MLIRTLVKGGAACLAAGLLIVMVPSRMLGHCDTMNGPVVTAARRALEAGNVNLVLIWVQKKDEADIRAAFQSTLTVRKLGPDAKALADVYFFETVVRVHRAGEGVPYTGLKPAETEADPGIAAADNAIATGSSEALLHHLDRAVVEGIHHQFEQVAKTRSFKADDVAAGRAYVAAYVSFIHYVERLYQAASAPAAGHLHEAQESAHP